MRIWSGLLPLLALWGIAQGSFSGSPEAGLGRIVIPNYERIPRIFEKRADGLSSAGITPLTFSSDKQSYYTVIKLGDINFRVALDTASSDLWTTSSACSTNVCKAVPKYPLSYKSPTFQVVDNNGTTFNASYADGTVAKGFVAREAVQLANLTAPNQAFGVITDCNVTLVDEISGVLGLGFPRLSSVPASVVNASPFFSGLAQQGLLEYPLFGLSLTRDSNGTLSLGAIDASVVTQPKDIKWNPVVQFAPFAAESNTSSYFQWAIPLSGFYVNNTLLSPLPTYPNQTNNVSITLIDVGTAGIFGPYQDVTRLYSMLEGSRLVDPSGQWAVPCDTTAPIGFVLGGFNFTLHPSDYLIGPASGNPNLCLSWPRALPPSSDGIDWQLGSAFLRTVYSVFSYGINAKEPPMVGFYPLLNRTASQAAPIGSFLSSISATIATTLPNFPLSTPTFTTPPYAFNTSVSASIGGIVTMSLATSTYSPILAKTPLNASALPTISPPASLATFILTNAQGLVTTSTSTIAQPSVTLGVPPGWSAAHTLRISACHAALVFILTLLLHSYIIL